MGERRALREGRLIQKKVGEGRRKQQDSIDLKGKTEALLRKKREINIEEQK